MNTHSISHPRISQQESTQRFDTQHNSTENIEREIKGWTPQFQRYLSFCFEIPLVHREDYYYQQAIANKLGISLRTVQRFQSMAINWGLISVKTRRALNQANIISFGPRFLNGIFRFAMKQHFSILEYYDHLNIEYYIQRFITKAKEYKAACREIILKGKFLFSLNKTGVYKSSLFKSLSIIKVDSQKSETREIELKKETIPVADVTMCENEFEKILNGEGQKISSEAKRMEHQAQIEKTPEQEILNKIERCSQAKRAAERAYDELRDSSSLKVAQVWQGEIDKYMLKLRHLQPEIVAPAAPIIAEIPTDLSYGQQKAQRSWYDKGDNWDI